MDNSGTDMSHRHIRRVNVGASLLVFDFQIGLFWLYLTSLVSFSLKIYCHEPNPKTITVR